MTKQFFNTAFIFIIFFSALSVSAKRKVAQEEQRDKTKIYFPREYKNSKSQKEKWPLVVLLHAFKMSGSFQKFYLGLSQRRINKKGFVLLVPGSTRDSQDHRSWNAMDYCCGNNPADDVTYLTSTIQETIKQHRIDEQRVYLLGHSNGGMMVHRMICEQADLFAAAVSLAGSGMRDPTACQPSSPVALLQIHATNDQTVPYDGMTEEALKKRLKKKKLYPYSKDEKIVRYPSALETVKSWAGKNGCDVNKIDEEKNISYSFIPFGKETSKMTWSTSCKNNSTVSLWTLKGSRHVPRFNAQFKNDILDFLLDHRKAVKLKP